MEDNTIIAEATAHTNSKNLESKMPTTAAAVAYDPDDYMYDYEDDFYYYDKRYRMLYNVFTVKRTRKQANCELLVF